MSATITPYIAAWFAADDAWSAELRRVYGPNSIARYRAEGIASVKLASLRLEVNALDPYISEGQRAQTADFLLARIAALSA